MAGFVGTQVTGLVRTLVVSKLGSVYRIDDRILYITMLKCLFKYSIEDGETSLLHYDKIRSFLKLNIGSKWFRCFNFGEFL